MKRDASEQLLRRTVGFAAWWSSMLTRAMVLTGRGYKRDSERRDVKIDGRRPDKLDGTPKRFRQYQNRYQSVPMRSAR